MNTFARSLEIKGVLTSDGAWGTELSRAGLPPGVAPEQWNLDNPDAVRRVAQSYVDAGADIILTNSFGGSRFKLAKAGLDDVKGVNLRAAEISRAAAGDRAFVFASVGPTGEFMAPLGTISEAEMRAAFAEQIGALVEGGADGIVIETMTALDEALAALRAAKETCDLPVVASFTFDSGPAGYATMMGVRPEQAAAEVTKAGAQLVGSNCGLGAQEMVEVVRLLKGSTDLPIWAKPNAGAPQLVDGETVFRETPEETASRVKEMIQAGARVVGGCCGTTPEHIRLIAQECAAARA